jgi:hypothetical protein
VQVLRALRASDLLVVLHAPVAAAHVDRAALHLAYLFTDAQGGCVDGVAFTEAAAGELVAGEVFA